MDQATSANHLSFLDAHVELKTQVAPCRSLFLDDFVITTASLLQTKIDSRWAL